MCETVGMVILYVAGFFLLVIFVHAMTNFVREIYKNGWWL